LPQKPLEHLEAAPLLTTPQPSVQTQKDENEIDFYKDIKVEKKPEPETKSVSQIQKQSAAPPKQPQNATAAPVDPALSEAKKQIIAARELMKK